MQTRKPDPDIFISKKISKLEQALNTKLITRSTRQLTLTESGEKFFLYCEKVVAEGAEAYAAMQHLLDVPSGTLKISCPPLHFINLII